MGNGHAATSCFTISKGLELLADFVELPLPNQEINLEPNAYMFTHTDADGRREMTPKEIQQGAQEVYRKLRDGVYIDTNNEYKPVNGDLTKLRFVPNLSAAARKVLSNTEARARKVAGTHEVRSTMRHQTHAYRVSHSLAIFITFSPSERDSAIMLRMVRARHNDPAIANDKSKRFYGREAPALDVEFCRLSVERLAEDMGGKESLSSFEFRETH